MENSHLGQVLLERKLEIGYISNMQICGVSAFWIKKLSHPIFYGTQIRSSATL
jgi:hypothetical protein